jgi:NADPH:quinone reductase-like Zn-dependent oxidoreductase
MKAIKLAAPGDIDQLQFVEIDKPKPSSGEVLIKTKAISINPVDIKTRIGKGMYSRISTNDPIIIGWDMSGIIDEIGDGVTSYKVGDEVFGMVHFPGYGKAYAHYVAAPVEHITRKPSTISHEEAAAATLAALTAWQVLATHANVQPNQKVLIHAAAGGVGHYAVQIAKYLGAYVIGTSSATKKEFVLGLGADLHIDYTTQKFEHIVTDADLVFDTIGGEIFTRSLNAVKKNGLVVSIPTGMSGDIEAAAKAKGVRAKAMLVQSSATDMAIIADLLKSGKIKSHIAHIYPFAKMRAAHAELEKGRTTGKIVVAV